MDKDCEEVPYDQRALLLSDPNNTEIADEAGYVAIAPTEDRKWAVRFLVDDERDRPLRMNDPPFVFETLHEAKRYVDILLGFDTPDIPLFSDY